MNQLPSTKKCGTSPADLSSRTVRPVRDPGDSPVSLVDVRIGHLQHLTERTDFDAVPHVQKHWHYGAHGSCTSSSLAGRGHHPGRHALGLFDSSHIATFGDVQRSGCMPGLRRAVPIPVGLAPPGGGAISISTSRQGRERQLAGRWQLDAKGSRKGERLGSFQPAAHTSHRSIQCGYPSVTSTCRAMGDAPTI
jgi:hypothetical protein